LVRDDARPIHPSLVLLSIPALWRQFRPVPGGFWVRHGEQALVSCVCGRRPVLRIGELVQCDSSRAYVPTRAGCSRVFFLGAERLHVAFSPPESALARAEA
jgi:hypothetical protein